MATDKRPRSERRDDLDFMLDQVRDSPEASAAFEDEQRRDDLLTLMVAIRKRARLSQRRVADAMGTTQSAVSDMERRRVEPLLATVQRYARAVGQELELTLRDSPAVARTAGTTIGLRDPAQYVAAALTEADQTGVRTLLRYLLTREHAVGPRSRPEIEEATGLSAPAVGRTVNNLYTKGWLTHLDQLPDRYGLRDDRAVVIGVSVRPDHILGVLTNLRATRSLLTSRHPLRSTDPAAVIGAVVDFVDLVRGKFADREILGLGVVLGGLVDGPTGTVLFASDLESAKASWRQVHLENDLQERTRLRTAVENEANALAMHEYLLTGGTDSLAVALLSAGGVGIGAGLVVNGKIMHGRGGISGEIGHIVVEENGRPCRCGENRGCLETVASATAIGARISGSGKAPMKLAEAAARVNVDESTYVAFSEAGHAMGSVLASLVSIVGPDRLMLVGPQELVDAPVQPSADYYIKGVLRGLERSAFRAKAQLETRVLDDTAEPRAAASVAVHYFLSEPFRWLPAIGSEPRPVYSVRSTPAVETNAAWEVLVANFGATDA